MQIVCLGHKGEKKLQHPRRRNAELKIWQNKLSMKDIKNTHVLSLEKQRYCMLVEFPTNSSTIKKELSDTVR